jgi:hypothetical protein
VKNLKLICVLALAISCLMTVSCSKSNNSSSTPTTDSVLYSAWITLAQTPTDAGDTIYTQTISASGITQAVIDKGLVLTYIQDPNTGTIYNSSDGIVGLYPGFAVGKINLVSYYVTYTGFKFRYVIIPGKISTSSTSGTITTQQIKTMSYQEVSNLLKIPATGSSLKF